jgi:hypothetical protein
MTTSFVGPLGKGPERELHRCAAGEGFGEALGCATEKGDLTHAPVAAGAQPAGELFGGKLLTGSIEKDDRRAGGDCDAAHLGGGILAQFFHFEIGEAADAGGVIVEQGADFGAAGFAEHQQADEHERGRQGRYCRP